jgi:manganese oxidase
MQTHDHNDHGGPHDRSAAAHQGDSHAGHDVAMPSTPQAAQHTGHGATTSQPATLDDTDASAPMHHGGHDMTAMPSRVTRPQLLAVTALTVLALAAASIFSAARYNLTLSAHDVGGLVMPPGMIMNRETSAQAMRDMAAVDLGEVAYTAPRDARGDQQLTPRIEGGVKVFDLETSVIKWNILDDARVAAYAFNNQVPGPRIRVTEGDRVRFNVTNNLPEPTTIHWHGLILPNDMDGPAEITQEPIPPGGRFTYEFTTEQAGTFFYHSHTEVDRQQALGLYGALIIDPRTAPVTSAYDQELVVQLQEWTFKDGYTFPAMPMEGALPNFFTINGKAYPETETVELKVGERLLVRFIGSSSAFIHPMHIHGGPFTIVQTDGYPVPAGAQFIKDTVNVGPGERYDVIWEAREPGKWLLHCHINHHTTNDNREEEGGGGLMLIINVRP